MCNYMVVEVLVDADGPEEVPMVEQRVADTVEAFKVTQLTRQPIDVLAFPKFNHLTCFSGNSLIRLVCIHRQLSILFNIHN